MTIRKIQKFFAGVLTVSVLTASLFGGSALASETETVSEKAGCQYGYRQYAGKKFLNFSDSHFVFLSFV